VCDPVVDLSELYAALGSMWCVCVKSITYSSISSSCTYFKKWVFEVGFNEGTEFIVVPLFCPTCTYLYITTVIYFSSRSLCACLAVFLNIAGNLITCIHMHVALQLFQCHVCEPIHFVWPQTFTWQSYIFIASIILFLQHDLTFIIIFDLSQITCSQCRVWVTFYSLSPSHICCSQPICLRGVLESKHYGLTSCACPSCV